jgi:hypothetical protein
MQFEELVQDWSNKHNLGDTWVPRLAGQRLSGEAQAWEQGWVASRAPTPYLPGLAELQPLRWDPFSETEGDFLKRMTEYTETIKRQLSAAGAQSFHKANQRDLRRLVRWHVLQQSPETIAKAEAKSWRVRVQDIRRAVKELAHRLELPDRPVGKSGRPRKTPGGQ